MRGSKVVWTGAWDDEIQLLVGGRGHGKRSAQAEFIRKYALGGDVRLVDGAVVIDRKLNEPTGIERYLLRTVLEPQPNLSEVYRVTRDAMMLMIRPQIPPIASIRRAEDTKTPVAPNIAPGMDNVNIITDRVPPHIAALPEPEQGPALVEAIFERKRRAQK